MIRTIVTVIASIFAVFAALMSWCAAIGGYAVYVAGGGDERTIRELFLDGESTKKEEVKKPMAKKSYGFNW